jgi:hypothetical protein
MRGINNAQSPASLRDLRGRNVGTVTGFGQLGERDADYKKYADIMIHIMFGAYTVMWVEACNDLISRALPGQMSTILSDFYREPKFFLGLFTFLSLTCLWWWYTRVFFKSPIFAFTGMSIWDLILLAAFALAYNSWERAYDIFGFIFFSALVLLMIRFSFTLLCVRKNANWNFSSGPEVAALWVGAICLGLILIIFGSYWGGALLGNDGGQLREDRAQTSLAAIVAACIASTILASFVSSRIASRTEI